MRRICKANIHHSSLIIKVHSLFQFTLSHEERHHPDWME